MWVPFRYCNDYWFLCEYSSCIFINCSATCLISKSSIAYMDQQVQAKKPNKVSNSIQKIKLRSLIFKLKLLTNNCYPKKFISLTNKNIKHIESKIPWSMILHWSMTSPPIFPWRGHPWPCKKFAFRSQTQFQTKVIRLKNKLAKSIVILKKVALKSCT